MLVVLGWFFFCCIPLCAFGAVEIVEPEQAGMDSVALAEIDPVVQSHLKAKNMPGCVICIGRKDKITWLKAYGNKRVETEEDPRTLPTDVDTIYDLASLTKPLATAVCIMKLVEMGKINIDAPVARYLSEFADETASEEKKSVTVRQLLTHTAGFIPDNNLADYEDGKEMAQKRILALNPIKTPGTKFMYSDVSFQILGLLVERVSETPLDQFAHRQLFEPMGLLNTGYLPDRSNPDRFAPTHERELGKVHDPRAYATDGVAGHAGLFSCATDLAAFASMLLGEGRVPGGPRILQPETVRTMFTAELGPGGYRALGWDALTGFSRNRGLTMSPQAVGHSGFTGTSIWIDPEFELFVILLSNRLHPDGHGGVVQLSGQVGTIAVDAITELPDDAEKTVSIVKEKTKRYLKNKPARTLPGIDLLEQDRFSLLKGKRVGFISNHTGLTQDGRSIVSVLKDAPDVKLTALFSPEHGFSGQFDQENVPDSKDKETGLKIFSLYGEVRKPTGKMLENVDILVFDIQDIGARFYTYIATMLGSMEAAAMKGIPFVVLDRPNPINGVSVEGPILDPGAERTVGCFRIPLRHGMTVGELALMMNVQRRLGLDLYVIPCAGWTREMDYDQTDLTWVNPSPNMRSLEEAYLYPGVGLLEFTNLSVGRGTSMPFEVLGAPWINEDEFVTELQREADHVGLKGVTFKPIRFAPDASVYQNECCAGVEFKLEAPKALQSVQLGIVLIKTLRKLYPDDWKTDRLNTLLLHRKTLNMILENSELAPIQDAWQPELNRFLELRKMFLLYPEGI